MSQNNKRIYHLNMQEIIAIKAYTEMHKCKVSILNLPYLTFMYPDGNTECIKIDKLVKVNYAV